MATVVMMAVMVMLMMMIRAMLGMMFIYDAVQDECKRCGQTYVDFELLKS